jgi:adenylate cyclase
MKPAKRSWRRINIIPLIPPLFALADKGFPSVALTTREEDGIARYYPLVQRVWIQDDFYLISNLALSAYLKMNQLDTRDIVLKEHAIHIPLRDIHIPINSEGNAKILWKGAWKNVFPQKELIQILREYQEASDPEAYRKQWKGKICFIGETSIGSHDRRNTPFDKDYPMVGAHAHFMKQLLTQEFIREAGFQENLGFLTIFMLLALLGLLWDSWKINIFSLCLLALFIPATFIFFYIYFHTLYIVTYPLFALSLLSLNTFLYRYITIGRSQRAIRYMFATMVSPEILSYMEKNPSAFSLKGESKEVSVLFSDIAGFTSISEKMHPSTLVKLLNFYLTAMTDIIIKYNGYIDKYEGDAIMAVWGVPINSSSHALDCCLSALEQLKALGELQKELTKQFGVEIQIRIGINTGIVSAGCMGSEKKKMSYTIIGDVVNLGSRLESANKNYQTQILIGQNTYQSIQNHLIARPLDRLIVVGKTEPVTVYELLGKRGEVEEEAPLLFAQALQLYWEKKWDQAQETFEQYLQKHPQDTVTPLYLERIALLSSSPSRRRMERRISYAL